MRVIAVDVPRYGPDLFSDDALDDPYPHLRALRDAGPIVWLDAHDMYAAARYADVLVHEACRISAMAPLIAGTVFETIFNYHADTVELGAMAARAGVPHVVLTHLIPPPEASDDAEMFAEDLRRGGYQGRITVGEDLTTIRL